MKTSEGKSISTNLMQRVEELDALRGLMLVWITLTHLPTRFSAYVNQPFGFVSAAEGFIFLSALFTGRIYSGLAETKGYIYMQKRLWSRTLRLYLYHLFLLSFVFVVAVPIASSGTRPGLYNLLDFYFNAGARRAIVDSILLVYRPPLLDILPMYVIFLALSPLTLRAGRKLGWNVVIGVSLVLWLLAQRGFRQFSWEFLHRHCGLNVPLNEMGSFDLWSWQFLWIVGVWMGARWARNELRVMAVARKLIAPAVIVVFSLLSLRYVIGRGFELGATEILFDKWHLGLLRLMNFAAATVILIRVRSYLRPLAIRSLILLGRSSLQVFCAHLFFCFAGLTLLGNASVLTNWEQLGLLGTTFGAMWITAKLFAKDELKEAAVPEPSRRQTNHPSEGSDEAGLTRVHVPAELALSDIFRRWFRYN